MYVQKARGEDKFKYHKYVARPKKLMDTINVRARNNANEELTKIFYSGSEKIGNY